MVKRLGTYYMVLSSTMERGCYTAGGGRYSPPAEWIARVEQNPDLSLSVT